ncbi:MAG: PSD1 domain-containing protein [Bryobacterales bacterium]|nr:PSD1 domain-containing protein [Bryobacterales bacterium]
MQRCVLLFVLAATLSAKVDFSRQVEPVLRARCQGCHGAAQQMSGLRLDSREGALTGGYAGAVIAPGRSAESKLVARVVGGKGINQMPPGKPLSAEEIAVLKTWIDEGAEWPASKPVAAAAPVKSNHWAFQPVKRPANGNSIDAFVQARLQKEGLQSSPEADRATLLRRVFLDLTGLPPTPDDVANADSYEQVVDRLLQSPHFGERWARPWLDRARYADSDGYEKDWVRPYAWRYRHWVINAFNQDMTFDRFTAAQLAGDQMGGSAENRVATGFLRMTLTNREGGIDNKQFRFENTIDRVNTVGATWLGLTVGCTQCHDHKYDPVSQKDYYQLFAYFDGVEEVDVDAPMPGELGPYLQKRDEYQAKRDEMVKAYKVPELQAAWEKEMLRASANPGERTDWDLAWDCLLKLTEAGDGEKIIRIPAEKRTARQRTILEDHFIRNYHFAVGPKVYEQVKFKELDTKLRGLKDAYPQLTQAMAVEETAKVQSYLRVRGDYQTNGIPVKPAVPAVLPQAQGTTRLDLARWLTSREHPLTSRVTVNWIWAELFGRGLVKGLDDFGVRAEKPTHPELLDYLASQFMDNGWSMKKLIREIVLSKTYRQASTVRKELESRDPENALLARQTRIRLPAELIRDSALHSAGLLSLQVGGKSVKPPLPEGVMELGYGGRSANVWKESTGADKYRRGLYVHFQRSTPHPMLLNFDAPKANVALCKRERSNTPLQALNLLNDPVFFEAAAALAHQVMAASADWSTRLEEAFRLTLARKPSDRERRVFENFFTRQKEQLAKEQIGSESAAWTSLASVLLNTDEFITRE